MDRLQLIALDQEDIEVISAHLQDAVVKAADIRWRPAEKRLVIALNRFDWEAAHGTIPEYRRRRAALRFERVTACKCRNCVAVEAIQTDRVLNLLAVVFEGTDHPAGVVTLTFSGGATLRLEVECLEAELTDLGPAWVTESCPAHPVEGDLQGDVDGEAMQAAKQG